MRTVTRFRGTVRSIQTTARASGEVTPIDEEMSFIVSIDVDRVEEGAVLQAGERRNFGVHSPSRIFGAGEIVGTSVDLEAEWMACDGKFRRFVSLRKRPSGEWIEDFDGGLEVGHTYRGEVKWDSDSGLMLVKRLSVPRHHGGGVHWTNLDAFPDLTRGNASRTIVLEVVGVRISQIEERRWVSMFDARIVSVQ